MTALQAAGGGLPLALHIPHVVEQAGALAGFAAVIGLAVLSALYFSQARDLRRLREWAGRAPERAAEGQQPLPGRVVPVPQQRPGPATPGATNGDAAPSVAVGPAAPAAAGVVAAPGEGAESANQAEGAKPGEAKDDEAKTGEGEGDGTKDGEGDEAGPTGADETDKPEGAPGAAKPEGAPDAAKPGMPAAASAAAAAGAGAASALGPAAAGASTAKPPTPGAPGAPSGPARPGQPQRPPGSVLPPRTGTLPPVRRLPSSTVGPGPAQTGVLGSAPSEKNKRNPVYVVLAVA